MTYEQALAFWYGRIDYERRTPLPGDLKLDRMRRLLHGLGNPHERLNIVHIAGTKGKGSTAAMLEAVLRQAGYRTGLFTSPHLSDVSERIRINGEPISPAEIVACIEQARPVVQQMEQRGQGSPTFFEVGTALGILHFWRRRVEWAVVEVGLGGRFDSTNVCFPVLSIITSISYDHMQQLGHELWMIAREKAGIIKPGRPVVSTAMAAEARPVLIRTAEERGSRLMLLERDFHCRYEWQRPDPTAEAIPWVQVTTAARTWPPLRLGLLGRHQGINAAGVVAAVEELRRVGWPISDAAVQRGLAEVRWPARLETLQTHPRLILDCAHNVASIEALIDTLNESFPRLGQRILVFAASSDKDVVGMLRVLAGQFDHYLLTRYGNNPRAVPPEKLATWLHSVVPGPIEVSTYDDALTAVRAAQQLATPNDLICVTGSVFLAGEVRAKLLQAPSENR